MSNEPTSPREPASRSDATARDGAAGARTGGRHGPGSSAPSHHHVVPVPVYLAIFVTLLALTAITVWVAFQPLGGPESLHTIVAMSIAAVKALLVALYFMHVRYSVRLTWVFVAAGLLWLAILIAITVGDYVGRRWEEVPEGWTTASVHRERGPGLADRPGVQTGRTPAVARIGEVP